jgi:two-component system sensor histidine kinase HydH
MTKAIKRHLLSGPNTTAKIAVLTLMIGTILFLHYFTYHELKFHHALYRMLFYLPLVLGSFWFGLKGALTVCVSVVAMYLPYIMMEWKGFSFEDFNRLLEGMLFFLVALILGFLVERRKREYRARIEAERLAAVGRAVSEIAHDMKAPLMAIGGFAVQLARDNGQKDPGDRKKLNIIVKEASRLEAMLKDMLDYARPLELELSRTDLNRLILESVGIAEALAKDSGIALRAELEPSIPPVMLDVRRVQQVVLNLLTNGVQACPAGGHVIIRTCLSDRFASMDVIDCGHGIEDEDCSKIFQPFFSTKKDGTGLGLANVKKIVEAHRGEISFRANPDKGMTFTVKFVV